MTIIINSDALHSLASHSRKGYETRYKKEVGGHLLGKYENGKFIVFKAIRYNTPNAGRTHWSPNWPAFERKGWQLEKKHELNWLGVYHSHPETAGRASAMPSPEDIESHMNSSIELIIRISASARNAPIDCCKATGSETEYQYVLCGLCKIQGKVERVRVECANDV